MGLRFDLQAANWIAYLTQPDSEMPSLEEPWMERETLSEFLRRLQHDFFSSPFRERQFRELADTAAAMSQTLDVDRPASFARLLRDIRLFLATSEFGRTWTALIVPSGKDVPIDQMLCSREFLRSLVEIRPEDPGLILQLAEPPREAFSLTDVFPAFRTALNESIYWPGVLLWTRSKDSVFLPFGSHIERDVERRAHWIFSHLATSLGFDFEVLRRQYEAEFPQARPAHKSRLNVIHLSDLHIGSREASRRLPRVQQLLRTLIDEIGDSAPIVPVVTGDLMDDPNEDYLDRVRSFLDFLLNLGTEEPVVILGNHDVRNDGYLADNFKFAMGVPLATSRMIWYSDSNVALACFNSVIDGRLARGYIGEQQLAYMGNEIDRHADWRDYVRVSVLHHHPIRVEQPDWYVRPFYEKVFGQWFEKTDELEDAANFMQFSSRRGFAAILHGHKHIPRVKECPETGIAVFGCGSTVGKVSTVDRSTYMSINVISIDRSTASLSGRLLAERIPGEGYQEERRHEVVQISSISERGHRVEANAR